MRISVILSTYNQPEALEKVLWGYAHQTHGDFQLLVADDGSGPGTAEVIRRVRSDTGLRAEHVWHEDRGFRKCEILNRAILAADGDYLVFSDGDCIPRRDLVQVHAELAEPGRFLSGGCLRIPDALSRSLSLDDIRAGRFAELRWLLARGWRPGHRALRLVPSRAVAAAFDRLTPTRTQFGGHNASTWREAVHEANGFEMEMGYGGLDRALGYRLRNLGVRGKQVRHRAICVHLHHERPYRNAETIRRNREILGRIVRDREIRARAGLAELSQAPVGGD